MKETLATEAPWDVERSDHSVSAVVPTYNRVQELCRAVDSILRQVHAADEVIVVDDGSTDGTREALADYGDAIRYLRQPNQGVSAARNAGLAAALGRWIAFLDSDDRWLGSHPSDLFEILGNDSQLVWAFSTRLVELSADAPPVPETPPETLAGLVDAAGVARDYFAATGARVPCQTSTMMVRSEILRELNGFDPSLRTGEDLDLWWRIARDHPRVGVSRRPGVIVARFREDSLSASARFEEGGGSDADLPAMIEQNMQRMREADRLTAFEPVAALHLDGIVQGALRHRHILILREVGWKNGRLLPPRSRLLLYLCLASGRPGVSLLASLRGLGAKLKRMLKWLKSRAA